MGAYIRQRPPRWFWFVGVIATAWGLVGVILASVSLFTGQGLVLHLERHMAVPGWFHFLSAAGAFSAWLGGMALLSRSATARTLFAAALLGVVAQMLYMVIAAPLAMVAGWHIVPFMLLLLAISVVEIRFARHARRRGWIC